MNALTKSPFVWLLKREYWESRRGFLRAQIIVAAVLIAISILGIAVAEVAHPHSSVALQTEVIGLQRGTVLGQKFVLHGNLGEALQNAFANNTAGLVQGLNTALLSFAALASTVLFFVTFFYLLGALYDDRRDRSVLFWKSLPVSDTATVVSKVVTAILIAPLIAVVVVLAGFIAEQIIVSIWLAAHGLNPLVLLWAHTGPWLAWLQLLATIPVSAVWALPTIGWLLFWSAAVRSKPFLWAVAIPIIAGVFNFWIDLLGLPHLGQSFFWRDLVGRALLSISPGSWSTASTASLGAQGIQLADNPLSAIGYQVMGHAFALPQMWIGAIVGIALIGAAIWLRRWRDEA